MKIRSGFVSNSSSSSFCIYGWRCKDYNEVEALTQKLKIYFGKGSKNGVRYTNTQDGDYIVGVGNIEDEFDHYMDDWQDYECDGPDSELIKKLDKVAKTEELPEPEMYSDTWFNG
jgi:hypothetical protein